MNLVLAATEATGDAAGLAAAHAASGATASAWLIPVIPAVSAALLLLFGRRLARVAAPLAILAVGASAVMSTLVFSALYALPPEDRVIELTISPWLAIGDFSVEWGMLIDPLASILTLLVTWVGLLIHIYSVGYMHGDERYSRFFAYLNLFAASMLILVTGSSLLVTFVGWELVGLCSYLLIGFWYEKRSYAGAATKAFVVNRIGDVGFMVAMFVVFGAFGSLAYTDVLADPGAVVAGGTAVAIALLLFAAATGKSAQIPLFVWLPDAMAGPTPVSALIHAATMVTAGVYLIARTSPLFALVPDVGLLVAWVGVITALVAALIATAQNDLKKILAYSTVSQLGYMVVGVGLGAQVAGVFHLLTHGFFKALLFLAAGSVMHAMADETDVWRMGGLRKAMPLTFATSVIGWLAIAGVPPLSGFWSKEEVLVAALDTPGAQGIWVLGTIVAGLTAFYMTRWLLLIFAGPPRHPDGVHPHESPLSMTVPLILLAVASAAGGLLNYPPKKGFLHGWLEPSVVPYAGHEAFLDHNLALALVLLAGAVGIVGGFLRYGGRRTPVADLSARAHAPVGVAAFASGRFYVDEAYDFAVARPGRALAGLLASFDATVIDGAVNGTARMTAGLASAGRKLQTGLLRSYALAILAGAVIVALILLGGSGVLR